MTKKLTLLFVGLLTCAALVYSQTPTGGGIGFGVTAPQAHIHTSTNGTSGSTIPVFRSDVPNFSAGSWQHTILPVSGVGMRDYTVYSQGYNCDRSVVTEPSLCDMVEIDYQPSANDRWIEQYRKFIGVDGTEIRQFGATFNRVTNRVVEAAWKSQKFIWTDDREHQVMLGLPGEFNSTFYWGTPTNGTTFVFDRNDWPVLQQRSSSGGVLSLPFYDSANFLRVGDGAAGIHLKSNVGLNSSGPNSITRMWVQSDAVNKIGLLITPTFAGTQTSPLLETRNADGHATFRVMADGTLMLRNGSTLHSVTIADDNSCGQGYRCLRIPN